MTDAQLLDQLRQGSHEAFAEVVRRHIDWVYSVARRRVRDAHEAEDVVQAVFTVLFQKPPRLKAGQTLSVWLFTVVHHASLQALRSEARRRRRETGAAQMRELIQTSDESDDWHDLAPHLDELVQQLGTTERQAVLLRFYEQRSFAEIGTILGVTEEAARKRANRAVERLRNMLMRRGVTVPSTGLAGLLVAEAVKPAPAALAAQMTSTIVSAAAVPVAGGAFTLAKGVITMMTISKIKLVAAAIFAAIVLVGGGVLVTAQIAAQRQDAPAPNPQQAAGDPNWREKFDRLYRLDDGEVLKQIAPPYIPEREQFLQELVANRSVGSNSRSSTADHFMDLQWRGGKLQVRSAGAVAPSVTPGRWLQTILTTTLDMKGYEFDAPPALLRHPMPGDWIVRPEANISDKLQVLAAMLTNSTGKLVQVERKQVEREVVVASGDLKPDAAGTIVHFTDVQLQGASSGGGGSVMGGNRGPARGSIQAFLDAIANFGGMGVINETKASAATLSWDRSFQWQNLNYMPDGPDKQTLLQGRMESLSSQTGLKFSIEKRKVDLWQFTQAP